MECNAPKKMETLLIQTVIELRVCNQLLALTAGISGIDYQEMHEKTRKQMFKSFQEIYQ